MKNLFLTILILVFFSSVKAQNEEFHAAMLSNIQLIDSAKTAEDFIALANTFERISQAESKEWLPPYYAAFCFTMNSFMTQDKKSIDDYLDKADELAAKADLLSPNNSEITCLMGMINSGRIMVNPAVRGKKFGMLAYANYDKSREQDPTNPRPDYLQGQGTFYTPKAFGGGKEKAKPILQTAVNKYSKFTPKDDLCPNWGGGQCDRLLKNCEEE